MSGLKNVIIIGAGGGSLGPSVLNAFLDEPSFTITVLSRKNSSSTFPSTVNVIRAHYDSPSDLQKAFTGQDVVISLIAVTAVSDQNKFIDAAIAAGVKRFIPSEFGANTADPRARDAVPPSEAKYATVNYLKSKEKEISWTSFVTGPFFDWGITTGFLSFSIANKSATLYDNGTAIFSATNMHTIALAIVKSLEDPSATKNQYVYLSGFQTSQKQILEAAEKITGQKWAVEYATVKDLIAGGNAKMQKGDYFAGLVDLLRGVTFDTRQLGDLTDVGLWNERLGLPKDDFEKSVRAALDGKNA